MSGASTNTWFDTVVRRRENMNLSMGRTIGSMRYLWHINGNFLAKMNNIADNPRLRVRSKRRTEEQKGQKWLCHKLITHWEYLKATTTNYAVLHSSTMPCLTRPILSRSRRSRSKYILWIRVSTSSSQMYSQRPFKRGTFESFPKSVNGHNVQK